MHNVEFIEIKSFTFKQISLYVQLFLYLCIFGLLISLIFMTDKDLIMTILYGVLSLTMLVMAYNNQKFYKKKYMTYIYLVISVILILSIVGSIIW